MNPDKSYDVNCDTDKENSKSEPDDIMSHPLTLIATVIRERLRPRFLKAKPMRSPRKTPRQVVQRDCRLMMF